MQNIKIKCKCGCGKLRWKYDKRGREHKYIRGHLRGKINGAWKGDKIKNMSALHEWIKKRKPKPKFCVRCKKNPPYDLANISGKYNRDINNYEWLCRSCHMRKDGRINNLNKGLTKKHIRNKGTGKFIKCGGQG